jgi:hypothetical protein
MGWTHTEALGLASVKCAKCAGTGLTKGVDREGNEPCGCVLRSVFRSCLKRFHFCADSEPYTSKVVLMPCRGADSNHTWTRVSEDYMADFYLIAKRTLTLDEFKVFRLHFLFRVGWKLCCQSLGIDRGVFFHAVYRIEHVLGRVYREVRPYSLFPVDEYFGGTIRKAKVLPIELAVKSKRVLRPPMRKPSLVAA